jgi:hypothetical protein
MRALFLTLCFLACACGPNRTYPDRAAYVTPQAQALPCLPNLDGQIEAKELPVALGIPETMLVSPAGERRTVNLAGGTDAQGHRVWDLGADSATDQVAKLQASAPAGWWFASSFPTAQFVSPLDAGGAIQGVYSKDDSAVYLLGYASAQQSPPEGKTLVVYTAPVAAYRFPLVPGKTWVSVGEVRNATVRGLPYAGRDTYTLTADAMGMLELPDETFTQALRLKTLLSIEPAVGASIVRRQSSFVFECFGEVARATSLDGETQDDFTTTSELRRLGF